MLLYLWVILNYCSVLLLTKLMQFYNNFTKVSFGVSLSCLSLSLLTSLFEIHISCDAIEIELQNIENKPLSNRVSKNFIEPNPKSKNSN